MFLSRIRADVGDDRSPWGDFWFEPLAARSASGMRVSGDTALRLTAVYSCVRILAETMAAARFCLCARRADGGRDEITEHWLYRLVAVRPNRWQDSFQWREMMQGHIALRGNAYNRIVPDNQGGIAELVPLHPDRVLPRMLDSGAMVYKVRDKNGVEETLNQGAVFHLTGLQSNSFTGMSPIDVARDAIGEGLAQQDFSARFFSNDARPLGGWIEFPGAFADDSKRDAFRDSWAKGQSASNRGKTAVLDRGMKYHEVGINNRDSQFIEARKFKLSDIARIFRVPPHMIADLDRATNNNIEWQSMEFVIYTMTPWGRRWKAALEQQLLPDDAGLDCTFSFEEFERGDSKSRGEFYNLGVNGGWMTRNEVRGKEGLNPLPGLDKPLTPLNMSDGAQPPKRAPASRARPAPRPKAKAPAAGRFEKLVLKQAERAVRKEVMAARKAFERAGRRPSDEARTAAWLNGVEAFYADHANDLVEWLQCTSACAQAWCDRQLAELKRAVHSEWALGMNEIPTLLAAWEASAAGELAERVLADAERVQTSVPHP